MTKKVAGAPPWREPMRYPVDREWSERQPLATGIALGTNGRSRWVRPDNNDLQAGASNMFRHRLEMQNLRLPADVTPKVS